MGREQKKEKKKQNVYIARFKWAAGWLSVLAGSLLAVYVGLWRFLAKPLIVLYLAYKAGQVYPMLVVATLVKCWLSLTVAGAIWIIGYMGKCMLEEKDI